MSRQAFAQSRQTIAHRCMCSSLPCFSHSAAHLSHAVAHDSHIVAESGPYHETIFAAAVHTSAQSAQVRSVRKWSFWPDATSRAQWWAQDAHSRRQSVQAFAQCSNWATCLSSIFRASAVRKLLPNARNPIARNPSPANTPRRLMTSSLLVVEAEKQDRCMVPPLPPAQQLKCGLHNRGAVCPGFDAEPRAAVTGTCQASAAVTATWSGRWKTHP